MKYIIVDCKKGIIKRWGVCPESMLDIQATEEGEQAIEDVWDFDYQSYTLFSNGIPAIDNEYIKTRRIQEIRGIRDIILNSVDLAKCNAEKWQRMSEEERLAWSAYKQALRDFPSNCDPMNLVWPEPPK